MWTVLKVVCLVFFLLSILLALAGIARFAEAEQALRSAQPTGDAAADGIKDADKDSDVPKLERVRLVISRQKSIARTTMLVAAAGLICSALGFAYAAYRKRRTGMVRPT
jgi:hypothetical protein